MGRDSPRDSPGREAEEIPALLENRRADVRWSPHVGDRDLAVHPAGELAGGPQRGAGFRGKVHGDEKPNATGSHFGYFIRAMGKEAA